MLGLLAVAMALGILNVVQWQSAERTRLDRLEATLSRPARLPGQPILDPTLKELNFAQQTKHPLGLTTAEAERILSGSERNDILILDIRESAEVEMGTFTGARAVRYPDLFAGKIDFGGKRALLICHNGNRSSETCQALAEKGVDCRFIAGGLEKWIVEGRTAGGFARRSLDEVRAIPDYPNARRLLDTPEVKDAVARRNALFVDLRYPGEFAAGHLPGAVNLPLRRMTTPEIATAITALPDRPIIAPCYDRRSCFFGEVLGLELSRHGKTFLGRYTVPWEYFVPNPPPPHIADAIARANQGWWEWAADRLADLVRQVAAHCGLLATIGMLALLSRLLVLPISLKAERDQITAARIAGDVASLKARLAGDPGRLARALRHLYRREGLTPLRNQLALLMLPVLALSVAALSRAAESEGRALAWISDLASPDPWLVLPAVFAIQLALYMHWSLARTRRHVLLTWLVGVPAFIALTAHLAAAATLYLSASATLLLLQRGVVVGLPQRIAARLKHHLSPQRTQTGAGLPLTDASTRADVGNKAHRLGILAAAGIPVPQGLVLDTRHLAAWRQASAAERTEMAARIAKEVDSVRFAVRSSAAAEDGADLSFAGVYDSVLDVTPSDLPAAIDRVLASFASKRAASYTSDVAIGNIIVQQMVDATYAGVLFTRAPDAPGQMLMEFVEGTGEALVSGLTTPRQVRAGRLSATIETDAACPFDLGPLVRIGQQAEAVFGKPQDIEWTWRDGDFLIVQSRDITAPLHATAPALASDWDRVLQAFPEPDDTRARLIRNELSELLPRPTPLSLSLLEALYASGGSVDVATRTLGLGYDVAEAGPPALVTVLGRLYVNEAEMSRRAPRLSRLDVRRLMRAAPAIETNVRTEVLPALLAASASLRAIDHTRFELDDLLHHTRSLITRYATTTHVEAEIVNVMAEVLMTEARRRLARAGLHAADWLTRDGETLIETAIREAAGMAPSLRDAFLRRQLGHRAVLDYELATPRFSEDPAALRAFVDAQAPASREPKSTAALPKRLARLVHAARRFQTLKEDAKHVVLMELAEIRRALLALDQRLEFGGAIFYLTEQEVLALDPEHRDHHLATARARRTTAASFAGARALPQALTLPEAERASRAGSLFSTPSDAALKGTRVAGRGTARGRAYVVTSEIAERGLPLEDFTAGAILVTPLVHPAWLPWVLKSGGVVTETGGWLSHMAIVARERDIAMIVGAGGLDRIPPHAILQLELDGRIVIEDADVPRAIAAE